MSKLVLCVMVFNEANQCWEEVPIGGPNPNDQTQTVCLPMEVKGSTGGGGGTAEPITLVKDDIAEAIQGVDIDGDGDIGVVGN